MHTHGRQGEPPASTGRALVGVPCALLSLLISGCITPLNPPTAEEIREQTGTLTNMPLSEPWKAGAVEGPVADDWLATFDDAQLNALVTEGLANNPDLRVTAARVEQAAQYIELAQSALRPSVSVLGSGGVNMGGGDALQVLSLGASWELDLWGRMRYSRNAYRATHASAQSDFEYAQQSLAAMIAKSWFTATETMQQLQIAEEMVKSTETLVTLAEKRRKIGPGTEQDIALARANLGTLQDNAMQVRLANGQALRALDLLLGRYPAAEIQARPDLPALPGPVPAGLPLEMLERRPDIVAAERRVAAAFNRVGEAKAAMLPRIILNANVAALSSDILQLKSDFENPTGGVGARLVAPIYQGGGLRAQVQIRTLEQKEAVADYARLALRALGDVENTLAAASSLAEREQILKRNVSDNQRALELVQSSQRVGTADLRAVNQQELAVDSAKLVLLRVQSEQLSQRVNLHLVLGGSFAPPPEPEPQPEQPSTNPPPGP